MLVFKFFSSLIHVRMRAKTYYYHWVVTRESSPHLIQQLPTKPSSRMVSEAALNAIVMKIGNSVVVLCSGGSSYGVPGHNEPPSRYLDGRYVNA